MDDARYQELVQKDLAHWVHPQYHKADHQAPLMVDHAEGVYLYATDGNRYLDGLSGLWNAAVGHGRPELAQAASDAIQRNTFTNSYVSFTNEAAIELAAKVIDLSYDNMQGVYFTNSGSESNETNFKAARFYWTCKGKPEKNKIISRVEGYHGNTLAAMSATGMSVFYPGFRPTVAEIFPATTPGATPTGGGRIDSGNINIDNIVAAIEQEGADTVAAVIAEPVQGAGGVYPPPPDYFAQLRDVCDRYEVLLIADEVITGFGRTGKWFALEHFDVQPDMVSLAKAITSAYIPMGATLWSKEIHETITGTDPSVKFMHAYTNSGHPVAAAVALRNLQIFEDENLVENAAARGDQLLSGLQRLDENPHVGNVRGLGFMCGFDFLQDPETDTAFPVEAKMGAKFLGAIKRRGLISRVRNDAFVLAPPLISTAEQVDDILTIVEDSVREITAEV
ncbi:MAG: aspartate aminotransferase family protein [Chloroflexi bacterium]|nr:aspartate aminotransferase family protein [Chloroflexota bacterium]